MIASVTGNYRYWSGADEMQNVYGPILPPQLTGIKHKAPKDELFGVPRGWLYATDRLLFQYRNTEKDVNTQIKECFIKNHCCPVNTQIKTNS
jgi:hypothetical protein